MRIIILILMLSGFPKLAKASSTCEFWTSGLMSSMSDAVKASYTAKSPIEQESKNSKWALAHLKRLNTEWHCIGAGFSDARATLNFSVLSASQVSRFMYPVLERSADCTQAMSALANDVRAAASHSMTAKSEDQKKTKNGYWSKAYATQQLAMLICMRQGLQIATKILKNAR